MRMTITVLGRCLRTLTLALFIALSTASQVWASGACMTKSGCAVTDSKTCAASFGTYAGEGTTCQQFTGACTTKAGCTGCGKPSAPA